MDKFESLALWMALEISKNSDGDYAKLETRIAWSVWQSRQSEFDAMTEALLNQTQLLAKQKVEIEEKDKRIEKATAKWISIVTILTTTDTDVPDVIFKQLDQLHDALCGMTEIGDNNANS